jgi:hypothetical protein
VYSSRLASNIVLKYRGMQRSKFTRMHIKFRIEKVGTAWEKFLNQFAYKECIFYLQRKMRDKISKEFDIQVTVSCNRSHLGLSLRGTPFLFPRLRFFRIDISGLQAAQRRRHSARRRPAGTKALRLYRHHFHPRPRLAPCPSIPVPVAGALYAWLCLQHRLTSGAAASHASRQGLMVRRLLNPCACGARWWSAGNPSLGSTPFFSHDPMLFILTFRGFELRSERCTAAGAGRQAPRLYTSTATAPTLTPPRPVPVSAPVPVALYAWSCVFSTVSRRPPPPLTLLGRVLCYVIF